MALIVGNPSISIQPSVHQGGELGVVDFFRLQRPLQDWFGATTFPPQA